MLSDMSMRSCVYMLLFLVLVVNFNQFGSYTLFLYLPVLMRSWLKYQTVDRKAPSFLLAFSSVALSQKNEYHIAGNFEGENFRELQLFANVSWGCGIIWQCHK